MKEILEYIKTLPVVKPGFIFPAETFGSLNAIMPPSTAGAAGGEGPRDDIEIDALNRFKVLHKYSIFKTRKKCLWVKRSIFQEKFPKIEEILNSESFGKVISKGSNFMGQPRPPETSFELYSEFENFIKKFKISKG